MYILNLNDIKFFIRNLKTNHDEFDIKNFIIFASGNTRVAANHKLQHNRSTDNLMNNFYFNRFPCLRNALPVININLHPVVIKQKLLNYFWNQFESNFDPSNICSFSFLCCCSKCNKQPTSTNFNDLD